MDKDNGMDAHLDALFDQARATPPQVPQALVARVLADAQAVQPQPAGQGWRALLKALGGAPGLGGLITASCMGFWLGVAPPAALPDLAGYLIDGATDQDADVLDGAVLTAFGWDIEEG